MRPPPRDFTDDERAQAVSHTAGGPGAPGVLVLHGFTGNPASMRAVADAFVATDHHVEMPRLPGHGTTLAELRTTAWGDWAGAADDAYRRLAARAERVVIVGLSMGGSLALSTALGHPDARGLVLVNPATCDQPAAVREMLLETLEAGIEVVPRHDSDIALPGNEELNYEGTPLRQLLSLLDDGLVPMSSRYGELTMPLLLFTSHQDHVVDPADSVHLAAEYGGPVDHRWLARSYHVATQDYDRDDIIAAALEFVADVCA